MDLQYFFKILLRRKWLLVFVMLVAIVLTYYLVGLNPPSYKSKAIVETGIINKPSLDLKQENIYVQQFIIDSGFSILIQRFLNRTSMKVLTYRLLLHDLAAKQDDESPFRNPDLVDEEEQPLFSEEEIAEVTAMLISRKDSILIANFSPKEEAVIKRLAGAYGYDRESISKKLEVKRVNDTDYVSVEFEAENPELCSFVVNTLCEEFIEYQRIQLSQKEDNAVTFYEQLAKSKKDELDKINLDISKYKRNRAIVDLTEQSKITISQIKELELAREEENKKINGLNKAIENIDRYLDKDKLTTSTDYASSIYLNEDTRKLNEKIGELNDQYISTGRKNEGLAKQIASLRDEMKGKVKALANKRSRSEREGKDATDPESLLGRKIDNEVELVLAEESVKSVDTEIRRLRGKASSYVSAEAYLENLEGEKEIALNEYLLYKEKLDESRRMAQGLDTPLNILEKGQVPDKPQPSLRAVISVFAGVAAVSLAVLLIFFLTVFDNTLNSPPKFERLTGVPLLGTLNGIKSKFLDLQELFDNKSKDKRLEIFKESLRKIRHDVENSNASSFLFTSTKDQEGKTFVLITLAYSLSLNNKKVLVIDTNFKNNTLTEMSNKTLLNNPLHNGYLPENSSQAKSLKTNFALNGNIDIIGNRGGNHSPSEVLAGKDFRGVLQSFATKYDYIFLEAASLNKYSDGRELAAYVDKVVTVFDSETALNRTDKESIAFLNGLNGKFMGGILNKINLKNLN